MVLGKMTKRCVFDEDLWVGLRVGTWSLCKALVDRLKFDLFGGELELIETAHILFRRKEGYVCDIWGAATHVFSVAHERFEEFQRACVFKVKGLCSVSFLVASLDKQRACVECADDCK